MIIDLNLYLGENICRRTTIEVNMIKKIDINSNEFLEEKSKTVDFIERIHKARDWVYNPDSEINESVIIGLTRNQVIYNKKYCPCFMVQGNTPEEQKAANNRVCPCKIGIKEEIPTEGTCHCGIYCTKEYAAGLKTEFEAEVVAHTHSRGLSKDECIALLKEDQIDSEDICALLEARDLGFVNFNLIDVREWNEWKEKRIKGTDYLIPTTSFYETVSKIEDLKDTPVVVYCFSGSRSKYCQKMMGDMGFTHVTNLRRGIMSFSGETESGE